MWPHVPARFAPSASGETWRWARQRGGMAMVLSLAAFAGGGAAEVIESVNYKAYVVRQTPGTTLREALNRSSPVSKDGQRFHGYTHWNLRWTFRWFEELGGRCVVTAATTWLEAEILLPALAAAEQESSARFASYLEALRVHENGHLEVARAAAHLLERRIRDLPPASACALLEAQAKQVAKEVLDAAQREEQAYDRATSYGRSQGAWLR